MVAGALVTTRNEFYRHIYSFLLLLGSISQTLTYPFDVLRRKMQVTGMKGGSVKYNGALHALRSIIQTEGVAGLYRGLWPNLRVSWPLFLVHLLITDGFG